MRGMVSLKEQVCVFERASEGANVSLSNTDTLMFSVHVFCMFSHQPYRDPTVMLKNANGIFLVCSHNPDYP